MNWSGTKQRGRPRIDRPAIDKGTPELQARRVRLAAGGDPALTEYPLGLMLARGLATDEQHEAGCYYAFLYGRTIGRTQINYNQLYQRIAAAFTEEQDLSEEARVRIESLFRHGKNRLLAAGRRVCDATENLVVFGRSPRFLDPAGRRQPGALRADATELEAVRTGLDVLVACYGRSAGRTGRMEEHKAPSMVQRPPRDFSVDRDRN
jgi:hypothetical protein